MLKLQIPLVDFENTQFVKRSIFFEWNRYITGFEQDEEEKKEREKHEKEKDKGDLGFDCKLYEFVKDKKMNIKSINGGLMKSNEIKVLEELFSDSSDSVINQG